MRFLPYFHPWVKWPAIAFLVYLIFSSDKPSFLSGGGNIPSSSQETQESKGLTTTLTNMAQGFLKEDKTDLQKAIGKRLQISFEDVLLGKGNRIVCSQDITVQLQLLSQKHSSYFPDGSFRIVQMSPFNYTTSLGFLGTAFLGAKVGGERKGYVPPSHLYRYFQNEKLPNPQENHIFFRGKIVDAKPALPESIKSLTISERTSGHGRVLLCDDRAVIRVELPDFKSDGVLSGIVQKEVSVDFEALPLGIAHMLLFQKMGAKLKVNMPASLLLQTLHGKKASLLEHYAGYLSPADKVVPVKFYVEQVY